MENSSKDMQRKNEEVKNEKAKVEAKLKLVEDLEVKDDDIVEVNSKASGADGDLHEKHRC
ncbi:hypothetical protein KY284_013149 [Solanum tuberosum]|nr:hypothetical protein KY284_013149 [Solanum tuberosum]